MTVPARIATGQFVARNCGRCDDGIIQAIQEYNIVRNPEILDIRCECYADYQAALGEEEEKWGGFKIEERINYFLLNTKS